MEDDVPLLDASYGDAAKKYCARKDSPWTEKAKKWLEIKQELKLLEAEEKVLRQELIELANEQSCQGGGIRLNYSVRKGMVDYQAIPGIKEMNLELFRKPSTKVWIISELKSLE